MSRALERLQGYGPSTFEEMGRRPTYNERKKGVRVFNIKGSQGSIGNTGGQCSPVYFIDGEHDPVDVILKWGKENTTPVEEMTAWGIHQRISRNRTNEWKEASRKVFGPFDHLKDRGGNVTNQGGECPLCGEEYERYLPDHLPCD